MESLTKTDLKLSIEEIKLLKQDLFYKYASLDVGVNNILIQGSLKFSNPIEYNDPFDCHEYLIKLDIKNINIDEFVDKQYPNESRSFKRKYKRNINPNDLYQKLHQERKNYKITCFSNNYNSTLLWSHYADKHKGMCIGFEFPALYSDKFMFKPVKYIDKIPLIDGLVDADEMIRYWLSIKSICWEYEQEIRAVTKAKSSDKFELINYEKNRVKEIAFGCKVTQKEISDSIKQLKFNGFNVKSILFKKMEIDKNTFQLKETLIVK